MKISLNDTVLEITFEERMDSKNSMEASPIIEHKITEAKPTKVIFNMEQVDYIASAFLRICISVAKTAGKDKLVLINTLPQIKKVFKISGLESFFIIE